MPEIILSNGEKCLVDKEDFDRIKSFNWHYSKSLRGSPFAVTAKLINGKMKSILMHRLILNVNDNVTQVDHINHNALDNRRGNLRIATNAENSRNSRIGSNNTSGYKGVSWLKTSQKWRARIMFNRKEINLGCHNNIVEAAKAYNIAAKKYFGKFACLNKIGGAPSRMP